MSTDSPSLSKLFSAAASLPSGGSNSLQTLFTSLPRGTPLGSMSAAERAFTSGGGGGSRAFASTASAPPLFTRQSGLEKLFAGATPGNSRSINKLLIASQLAQSASASDAPTALRPSKPLGFDPNLPAQRVGGSAILRGDVLVDAMGNAIRRIKQEQRGNQARSNAFFADALNDIEATAKLASRPPTQTGGRGVPNFLVGRSGQAFVNTRVDATAFTPGEDILTPVDQDTVSALNRVAWDYTHKLPRSMYLDEAIVSNMTPTLADKFQFHKLNEVETDFPLGADEVTMRSNAPQVSLDNVVWSGAGYLGGGFQDPINSGISNTTFTMPPNTTFDRNFTGIGVQA